jgi:hypothetical protein
MVPIPKIVHFIWFGSAVDRLERANLKNCATANPDYEVNLWIDAQSMMPPEAKRSEMFSKKAQGLVPSPAFEKAKASVDAAAKAVIQGNKGVEEYKKESMASLAADHQAFLGSNELLFQWGPIVDLQKFCNDNKISLRYADLEYEGIKNSNLIHFEKVVRGGNLGAASDILRAELLHRYGGIYCDHDTQFLENFGQVEAMHGILFGVAKGPSNRATDLVPTNAVLAATVGHPWLVRYRELIDKAYRDMFATGQGFKAFFEEARPQPESLEKKASPYELGTLERTGPNVIRKFHGDYKLQKEIGGKQADFFFPQRKVKILSAKAWLLAAQ